MNDAQRIRCLPVLVVSNGVHAIFGALTGGSTIILFYNELGLGKCPSEWRGVRGVSIVISLDRPRYGASTT